MTIPARANLSRITATIWVNAAGSPVFPGSTRDSAIRDGFGSGARWRAASSASIASCRCTSQSIAA
jgi:hypothetical protein